MSGFCDLRLLFHGSVILLVSQLAGYVFLRAIAAKQQDAVRTGMWRMAHAASSAGAVFLIACSPIVSHLRLSASSLQGLVALLIVSTYGLCLGTVVAGFSGHRGVRLALPWPNLLACLLYLIGVLGSTVAGAMFFYGATRAYLQF